MSTINYAEFKKAYNSHCLETVGERLTTIEENLDSLMDAKRNETKSSAGDKYETGRAMIQNEEELYKRQRAETSKILDQLLRIDPDKVCNYVTLWLQNAQSTAVSDKVCNYVILWRMSGGSPADQ